MAILLAVLVSLLVLYPVYTAVFRLYFHPLSRFPGPRLAAITKWYEFYYDIVRWPRGQYARRIREMHERYGPIVRINPDEIHIKDPDWYDAIYPGEPTFRNKWPVAAGMAGTYDSTFGSIDHGVHRKRRAALSTKFSTRALKEAENMVKSHCYIMIEKLRHDLSEQRVVDSRILYLAYSTDSVCHFAFGEHMGLQEEQDRAVEWSLTMEAVVILTPLAKQLPWLLRIGKKIPASVIRLISPALARVVGLHREMVVKATTYLRNQHSSTATRRDKFDRIPATVFEAVFYSALPDFDKSAKRLAEEGFLVIGAGSETVAKSLTIATYHILANPHILSRLRQELSTVSISHQSIPELGELKKLPWLTAIIKETLRLSSVITARLPVYGPDPIEYSEWTIPPWTPVSLTIEDVLSDPVVFASSYQFQPERWIEDVSLDRYLVPFSKGTRMCLGMEFAYMELYFAVASVFSTFDLQLFETVRERDVDLVRDAFVGRPQPDSPGIRFKVVGETASASK